LGLVPEGVEEFSTDLVMRDSKNQIYAARYSTLNSMLLYELWTKHEPVEARRRPLPSSRRRLRH
jgi:hypothetical protein